MNGLKSQPFKDHFNDMINSKILEKEEYLIIKKNYEGMEKLQ